MAAEYALPLPEVYPPPPRRRRATGSRAVLVEVGRRSAWLRGVGLAAILNELAVPYMWDWHPDRKKVLMCPTEYVADVLALLEHRDGRFVEVTAVDR